MGILNITPDSFFVGSRYQPEYQQITDIVGKMLNEGADFLDVGGYSTRPHANEITVNEELDRVLPVIEMIAKNFQGAIISIDTFRSEVAKLAIKAGGHLINDISGGNLDDKMFELVADLNIPYILMHSRGNPETMTQLNDYQDITLDILGELERKVFELRQRGVKDIIVDVGFGFAKNPKQNFELLNHLEAFQIMDLPILAGLSRKSMIWKTLKILPEEALNGTTALNMVALMKGAKILRVHDVRETKQTIDLYQNLIGSSHF